MGMIIHKPSDDDEVEEEMMRNTNVKEDILIILLSGVAWLSCSGVGQMVEDWSILPNRPALPSHDGCFFVSCLYLSCFRFFYLFWIVFNFIVALVIKKILNYIDVLGTRKGRKKLCGSEDKVWPKRTEWKSGVDMMIKKVVTVTLMMMMMSAMIRIVCVWGRLWRCWPKA